MKRRARQPSAKLIRYTIAAIAATLALSSVLLAHGCGGATSESEPSTGANSVKTVTPYQRRSVDFFKGIVEPHAESWGDLSGDSSRLLEDGFNTVTLSPPVLITVLLGAPPQVIAQGEASSAESFTDSFHQKGLAVHLAPTTRIAGLSGQIDPTDAVLVHLDEDALRWAEKAELQQVELFSPLSYYNQVLGTEAANKWSARILPQVRQKYRGPVAAMVVTDLGEPPLPGQPHDFEKLDLKGYDFLMIDIFPRGEVYDAAVFSAYIDDVLSRAAAVVQRDGLKGVIVGESGSWREPLGTDVVDGPVLSETEQADAAALLLEKAMPRTKGVFYYGWTLAGRGAKDFPVEGVLRSFFVGNI